MNMVELHQTIVGATSNALVTRKRENVNVSAYAPSDTLKTPALLLAIEGFDTETDSDHRLKIDCELAFYCVLSSATQNLQQQLLQMSVEVADLVRGERWGLTCDMPQQIECAQAEFKAGENGYDSMVVTWRQCFYFGQSMWEREDWLPKVVEVNGYLQEAD